MQIAIVKQQMSWLTSDNTDSILNPDDAKAKSAFKSIVNLSWIQRYSAMMQARNLENGENGAASGHDIKGEEGRRKELKELWREREAEK